MRTITLLILCCVFGNAAVTQPYNFRFNKPSDTLIKSNEIDNAYRFAVYARIMKRDSLEKYSLNIIPEKNSTLSSIHYDIPITRFPFGLINDSAVFFIIIKTDSIEDRDRTLNLKLEVQKQNGTVDTPHFRTEGDTILNLWVKGYKKSPPMDSSLPYYQYLAYIGTNFDLVDGLRPKNLFFAVNTFLPPSSPKKVGYYMSLYGNRTMTTNDSTYDFRRNTGEIKLTDTTARTYSQQVSLYRTTQSDNLGAYCSPLFALKFLTKEKNRLKLYLTPSLEFVWRRTHLNYSYSNKGNLDSVTENRSITGAINYGNSYAFDFNEFVFNYGAGVLLVHETDDISIRVHGTIGHSKTFTPLNYQMSRDLKAMPDLGTYEFKDDTYFTGRAWLTEANTGITLQAEITNTSLRPRPFYGVTLSKALEFKNF